jgi:hypothetical protein
MLGLIGRRKDLGGSELFQRPSDLLSPAERSARMVGSAVTLALAEERGLHKALLNLFLDGCEAFQEGGAVLAELGFAGAPDIRRDLFTPFRTTKQRGLGIGPYQCRRIVSSHGGRIEVASLEGVGTVFTVWLQAPVKQGAGWVTEAV